MKKRMPVVFALLALLVSAARISEAQWKHVGGPEGGRVTGLTVSGKRIYASAGSRALFLSEDDGASWRAGSFYLPFGRLRTATGKTLVAGDSKFGFYLSTDGGSRWEKFSLPGPKDPVPYFLGPVAADGKGIYAACDNEIHFTSDNGRTWARIATGWPSGQYITALAADGGTIGVIVRAPLLKNMPDWDGPALYLSRDRGKTWKQILIGRTDGALAAPLAIDGKTLHVGLAGGGHVITEDDGATWRKTGPGLPDGELLNALTVKGSCLFAGTRRGVFRSTDGGVSWSAANSGLTSVAIEFLVERSGTLVAYTDRGVFLSDDDGREWHRADPGLPEDVEVADLVSVGPYLYAAAFEDGIFASSDGGMTWNSATPGILEKTSVACLASSGSDLIAGTRDGVFRLAKNGALGERLNEGLTVLDIHRLASSGGRVVAEARWGHAFMSTDAGAHWRAVDAGLPETAFFNCLVVCDGAFYAGTDEGVFVLSDDGSGWTNRGVGLPEAPDITCLAAKGGRIAAATSDNGVFISSDKGAHWKSSGTGLPRSVFILSLLFKGNDLLACTETGVWRLILPDGPTKDK